MESKNQLRIIIALVVFIIFIGTGVYLIMRSKNDEANSDQGTNTSSSENSDINNTNTSSSTSSETVRISWSFNGLEWSPSSEAPVCDQNITLLPPVDLTKATSVLIPGEYRGNDYKPHGGFRFDNSKDTNVNVYMPKDAYLWRGSRYIENGEVQILLDFVSSCGIMFRFDHLATVPTELQTYLDNELSEPLVDDSRTTIFKDGRLFLAGELIASQIGHKSPLNVGMDFGVYDLRKQNEISSNAEWVSKHMNEKETAFYAICWFDNFDNASDEIIDKLPAPGGKAKVSSDYCKF